MGYALVGQGLVSSNDGSHLALARALVVHGRTALDDEVGLTLWVDRAEREGRQYSDRPPGTAFVAAPFVWLGARADADWGERTIAKLKAGADAQDVDALVVHRPATDRYIQTYGARRLELAAKSPNLIALQGSALGIEIYAGVVGGLGLLGVFALLRRRDLAPPVAAVVVATLGLCTLWGPYSTMLFSHVTAATALVGLMFGVEQLGDAVSNRTRLRWGLLAGGCGALAVSADYALVLIVVPLVVLLVPWRMWKFVAVGATPVVLATLAYHDAAFGSPWSIGYDHHANFDFARSRTSTFSGNPARGFWSLFGAGGRSGLLAQSPIMLVGIFGLIVAAPERRRALAFVPWAVLLCFHQTPEGGAGSDHRYLIPALPIMSVGLAEVWRRASALSSPVRWGALGGLIVLTVVSGATVWSSFFAWRG